MNYTLIQPNITSLTGLLIYTNAILDAPFPTFFTAGFVLALSLIIVLSIVQVMRMSWGAGLVSGSAMGLLLTLIMALGGPLVMNIWYSSIYVFFLIVGVWMSMKEKEG